MTQSTSILHNTDPKVNQQLLFLNIFCVAYMKGNTRKKYTQGGKEVMRLKWNKNDASGNIFITLFPRNDGI